MNYECVPIIRLEVERLKTCVCHMMGIKGSELEKVIRDKIDSIDIKRKIEELVEKDLESILTTAIKEYFLFGEGKESMRKIIGGIFKDNGDII